MNFDKIVFKRTRAKNGYWATIRDADDRALFMVAVRGVNTHYTKEELSDIFSGLVSACKEDRVEWESE